MIAIKGVPTSISDTYYQLENIKHPKWLFQAAMIIPAMLLLPSWLDCSKESFQFLAFLSCGGLMFVGACPFFKLKFDGKVHYISAAICGGCAVLWLILSGMWYLPAICFLIALAASAKYSKAMFWCEMAAFVSTYLSVILKTFA